MPPLGASKWGGDGTCRVVPPNTRLERRLEIFQWSDLSDICIRIRGSYNIERLMALYLLPYWFVFVLMQ